jgi:hypothetical protein
MDLNNIITVKIKARVADLVTYFDWMYLVGNSDEKKRGRSGRSCSCDKADSDLLSFMVLWIDLAVDQSEGHHSSNRSRCSTP